jgi:glycosyltransferase involved in cell wall biosynthesis
MHGSLLSNWSCERSCQGISYLYSADVYFLDRCGYLEHKRSEGNTALYGGYYRLRLNGLPVDIMTLRFPPPARYSRILRSVSTIAQARLVTGTVAPTVHLGLDFNTAFAYASLLTRTMGKTRPAIIDVVVSVTSFLRKRRNIVMDFRTPYPLELMWLGHRMFASLARRFERVMADSELVFAANGRMASLCKELGTGEVHVLPNYPLKDFKSTVEPIQWKQQRGLPPDGQVVLFTGAVRLREIYGIDLVLESWRTVEKKKDSCILVILGDTEISYIKARIHSLNLKNVVLPGRVELSQVANWIKCSEVCLAPRTPGFPSELYDDKDSTKISEYAAFRKPIVATRYARSDQYELVEPTPDCFAEGIIDGLEGRIPCPTPHFWEENEPMFLKLLSAFWLK